MHACPLHSRGWDGAAPDDDRVPRLLGRRADGPRDLFGLVRRAAITVVALKPIAAELGGARSVPALAYSLAWFGSALGGVAMGWLAERIGVRWTVMLGALMIGAGLA